MLVGFKLLWQESIAPRVWLFLLLLVCQIAPLLGPFRVLWAIVSGNFDRAFEIMKSYDTMGNAVTNGRYNEFISTRANRARAENRRWGCVLCKLLDKIDKDHCAKSPLVPGDPPIPN